MGLSIPLSLYPECRTLVARGSSMSAMGWLAGLINAIAALATMMFAGTAASVSQTPDGGLTVDALRRGGYVIFIRHATADQGSDANGFNLEDCATQRNLGPTGIKEA